MDIKEFEKIVNEQLESCKNILTNKGTEYAFTKDRLKSFKDAAKLLDTNSTYALCGQLAKHIISIIDMCKSNEYFPIEKWNEKISDSINYLCLLKALVIETSSEFCEAISYE